MALTWHGREVKIYNESISELLKKIPEFGMYPFSIEEGIENEPLCSPSCVKFQLEMEILSGEGKQIL